MSRMIGAALLAVIAGTSQALFAGPPPAAMQGRAGAAVGAARVAWISDRSGAMGFWRQLSFVAWPGRAGGPVGWAGTRVGADPERRAAAMHQAALDDAPAVRGSIVTR